VAGIFRCRIWWLAEFWDAVLGGRNFCGRNFGGRILVAGFLGGKEFSWQEFWVQNLVAGFLVAGFVAGFWLRSFGWLAGVLHEVFRVAGFFALGILEAGFLVMEGVWV